MSAQPSPQMPRAPGQPYGGQGGYSQVGNPPWQILSILQRSCKDPFYINSLSISFDLHWVEIEVHISQFHIQQVTKNSLLSLILKSVSHTLTGYLN